jgi:hypothetical protein
MGGYRVCHFQAFAYLFGVLESAVTALSAHSSLAETVSVHSRGWWVLVLLTFKVVGGVGGVGWTRRKRASAVICLCLPMTTPELSAIDGRDRQIDALVGFAAVEVC